MKVCPQCKSSQFHKSGFFHTEVKTQRFKCKQCHYLFSENTAYELDTELVQDNVRLAKQKQKAQDLNRIERKSFREHARVENALEEFGIALKSLAELHGKELSKVKMPNIKNHNIDRIGVIHLTDWHANELIELPHNRFDFTVLAKRAEKLAKEAISIFSNQNINKVVILSTGDMMNSDRRLDELVNQATNRAKAAFLTSHIIKNFILEMRRFFHVSVVSVLGNESRFNKEMTFSETGLSDNYDFFIFNHLKDIFEASEIKGIEFGSVDKIEEIVKIAGKNWLIKHDFNMSSKDQKSVQSTIGRYSLAGHKIDYMITGHIHETRITDIMARGSSMAGSNTYNENALNLFGSAAQNIFITDALNIHKITIDLQDTNGYKGYDIIKELEAYNAKSASKSNTGRTILEIKI
jgi:transposase-like protein/predicted phosphodiesterase